MNELIGILIGHLYFFIMFKYPQDFGGTAFLRTPQILYVCLYLLCLFLSHFVCSDISIFRIESAACMDSVKRQRIEGQPTVITIERHMHGDVEMHSVANETDDI